MTDLALTTPSLMDALLGLSAFHLRCLDPSDQAISKASHKYVAQAVTSHAKQLRDGINEKNAETMFATSVFVTFHVL